MTIQHLFKPFEIEHFEVDSCPCKIHKHTFFEITYILKGEGTYYINGNKFSFKANDLFLIMPDTEHYTRLKMTSGFLFIRFNNIYLQAQQASGRQYSDLGEWIQKLEYILENGHPLRGPVNLHDGDQPLVQAVCEAILQGQHAQQVLQKELTQQLINTLITVVARNVALFNLQPEGQPQAGRDILHYIHQHIYEPEKLKAENIAAHFNISLNYVSEYFKKHAQGGMQQYIINYKLSLIEIRLRHSDMRLNEIAGEFGFTDESHFTKTFKKHKGVSPSAYRKGLEKETPVN
ncbi:AraC family transcriptional regulator [Chitinophaga lutea]|uniref:AraC family transcriptional regulator n=1 Tax=Chitinophaga lutea TaxID=2488634 RepID=A0A3N4PJF0_9BACT|nr:AraC family transcriptional regulator [Chitinophaga lutea]RPE07935.1 AraC family transcriptional regulator [Chitinophaga lutea]